MVAKKFIMKRDAQRAMLKGIEKLKEAVCVTLGSAGLNVALHKQFDYPEVTKDGITVAESMSLLDENEDVGLQLVKNASRQTVIEAGDGTTTAICLAHAVISRGLKLLEEGKCSVNVLRQTLLSNKDIAIDYLKKNTEIIKDNKQAMYNIALTSCNGDKKIAELVSEVYEKMGEDGAIELAVTRKPTSQIKYSKGYKIGNGFLSTAFVNVPQKMSVEFKNPYILLYDGTIDSTGPLLDLLNATATQQKSILIIANDYSDTVLKTFIHNAKNKTLSVCVVRSPYYASQRTEVLQDLAIMTGGELITPNIDEGLKKAQDKVGTAKTVIVTAHSTTIIDGNYKTQELEDRIQAIEHTEETKDPEFNDTYNKKRIAKMTKGVAVIEVGGETSAEISEKHARALDAMLAVKASLEEGISAGGGIALMSVKKHIERLACYSQEDSFIKKKVLFPMLEAPLRQIVENANEDPDIMAEKIGRLKDINTGWDTTKKEFTNMKKAGIIDPTKVTKSALKNAISVAVLILSTGCIVSDAILDPQTQQSPPPQ